MKELAEVISVNGDRITLTTQLKTACSGCSQKSTCGAGILSNIFADRNAEFTVVSGVPVKQGEQVEISLPESQVTGFALLLYGLPIVVLLALAMVLTAATTLTEGAIIVLAFAGFALTFMGLRRWFRSRDVKINQLIQLTRATESQ